MKPLLLTNDGLQVMSGLTEDITDIRHFLDIEQKYSTKKNAIIQILSHDLAGPLGNIQSLSSLVATRLKLYKDEDFSHMVGFIFIHYSTPQLFASTIKVTEIISAPVTDLIVPDSIFLIIKIIRITKITVLTI